MTPPLVAIFHQPPLPDDPPLTGVLASARAHLLAHQGRLFTRAGGRVGVAAGRDRGPGDRASFGERLARLVDQEGLDRGQAQTGLVVLGSGAVPLLTPADARRLVEAAASGEPVALTNNRYSSDVCAVGQARILRDLPPLPTDNALPRWLQERAGFVVSELPGRERLAIDLDTPLDLALLARIPSAPAAVRSRAAAAGIAVPRLDELRAVIADPRAELLVAGRSSSGTLRWLERNIPCRVRFLAEERGMRASSDLAVGDRAVAPPGVGSYPPTFRGSIAVRGPTPDSARRPRSMLGRLLDLRGPDALGAIVAELADAAILDTRVLLGDRHGVDEDAWPTAEDRFASDLLRVGQVNDPWMRALTAAAASSPIPILLGAHTIVGPGVRWLLAG